MTIRTDVPTGGPIWVDLMSSDPARSKAFYGEVLGWGSEEADPDFGGYTNLTLHGERVAGLMQAEPGNPDVWTVYLKVDDATAAVAAAEGAGGGVMVPVMPVGEMGTMAVVTDPGGAVIGMWQPGTHRGGVMAALGAPCHVELHTRDYDAVIPFYRTVFGWTPEAVADEPGFRYTIAGDAMGLGDGERAGIMDATEWLPEGVPAHWSPYFAVADADATLARIEELGGSVVVPAETTPYGRMATAVDPTGATFKLRQDV